MIDVLLSNTLQAAGLDDKEARVYLALVGSPSGSVSEIADKAELKRPIVYHVLNRLIKQGYVQIQPGKIQTHSACEPIKILQTVKTAAENLSLLLPMIRALQSKGRGKPRIEFFESKEAIVKVYRTYEAAKEVRYVTNMQHLMFLIPEEMKAWIERQKQPRSRPTIKNLLPATDEDKHWARILKRSNQEVRILPTGTNIEMDFAITNDALGITSFDPLFVVVIHSASIARSASQLFDLAWKQSRDVK